MHSDLGNWVRCMDTDTGLDGPGLSDPGSAQLGLLDLNAFKILDDGLDVVRVEHEDGHVGVPRNNSLGERLGEIVYGVSTGQRSEWRCLRMRAIAHLADCVAARTVVANEHLALVDKRFVGSLGVGYSETQKRKTREKPHRQASTSYCCNS
jgi:hypothetical protein